MRLARIVLLPLFAVAVAGIAGAAEPSAVTGASAVAVSVTLPGAPPVASLAQEAPPNAEASLPDVAFPEDGSVLRTGAARTSVTAVPGVSASAQGVAEVLSASLFGGEITAESVTVRATAAAGAAAASASAAASAVTGLVVLGQPVPAGSGLRVPLADWGVLEVLATADDTSEPGDASERRASASVTGMRISLTADHGGLPAGAVVEIGRVEATAVVPVTSSDATPARPLPPSERPLRPVKPVREPGRSEAGAPDELVRPLPDGVAPRLSTAGYVFPVWGPASFGDTFGAFRGDVPGNWHHGEDIFAPHGTPLLAVADGTVYSVGWNDIGGWRLWLRDALGNQFYYAHLSAYSPLAVEGGKVRAGDVLGFMGKTGDAEHSPPHVHFEIHPASLTGLGYHGVIAAYPYLVAWRRAEDVSFAAGRAYVGVGPGRSAPPPAPAVLLESEDIASTSGLVPGALARTLAGS